MITTDYISPWTDAFKAAEDKARERDQQWVKSAVRIIQRLAFKQQFVHVNDFWDAVDRMKTPLGEPSDRRYLGQAFRIAAKKGYIETTDTARRSSRHGSYWRVVWRSRKYNGAQKQYRP